MCRIWIRIKRFLSFIVQSTLRLQTKERRAEIERINFTHLQLLNSQFTTIRIEISHHILRFPICHLHSHFIMDIVEMSNSDITLYVECERSIKYFSNRWNVWSLSHIILIIILCNYIHTLTCNLSNRKETILNNVHTKFTKN